jgi:hypothetical protein
LSLVQGLGGAEQGVMVQAFGSLLGSMAEWQAVGCTHPSNEWNISEKVIAPKQLRSIIEI